jgi:proteasome lid subunit RPN8/RPN11
MGKLEIPLPVFEEMKAHAAEGYPYEIVGVMAGDWGETKRVRRLFRGANQFRLAEEMGGDAVDALREDLEVEGSSANRFFLTGEEMLAIDAACRAEGIDILGCYHTHPDHPSRPSPTDLHFAQQTLPGYSYVIISVEKGVPTTTTCWVLSDDETRFDEEAMVEI